MTATGWGNSGFLLAISLYSSSINTITSNDTGNRLGLWSNKTQWSKNEKEESENTARITVDYPSPSFFNLPNEPQPMKISWNNSKET